MRRLDRSIVSMMGIATVIALSGVSPAQARTAQPSMVQFDIPAGSLGASIVRLGQQAGVVITVDPSLVRGHANGAFHESTSVAQAAARLLANTGLTLRQTGERIYVVERQARLVKTAAMASAPRMPTPAPDFSPAPVSEAPRDEEIVVTAQRREERLQDVPISITVYSQEDLAKRNVAVASDLATYTPSLSVNQRYGPEKASFAIRGFNQSFNTAPTVGVYFAEVVGIRAQGSTTSGNSVGAGAFSDLENVQILKGPQGTLFGRNTTGGAILLTPRKPTRDFGGYVDATYGNFDQIRLNAALNLPLSDTFRVRISGERNSRDGYMKNHAPGSTKDFNDVNYAYGRLSIVGDLTPNLENYTIVHYSRSDTNGIASRTVSCARDVADGGTLVTTVGAPGYNGNTLLQTLSCRAQIARQTARGDGLYDVESAINSSRAFLEQWQIVNTTTWQVGDNITIKNIASYGELREKINLSIRSTNYVVPNFNGEGGFNFTKYINSAVRNPDGSEYIIPAGTPYLTTQNDNAGPGTYSAEQSTFTEELQLQGKSLDGRLNYVAGGYLEFSRPLGFSQGYGANSLSCTVVHDLACSNPLTTGSFFAPKVKTNFDNHGVFAQGTYKISDKLALTAGGRWTFDKIEGASEGTRFVPSIGPGSYIDPRTGVSIRRTCLDTVSYPGKVVQDTAACLTKRVARSNRPTWLINLEYKPNHDLLVYGKYARAYRQGGLNFNAVGFETWGPEQMESFEIGSKLNLTGGVRGYFNVAGFYNSLSDMQVTATLSPTLAAQLTGIQTTSANVNAANARSYGAEIDTSLLFFDRLRLTAGYTYLDTKIVKIASPAELAPQIAGTVFASIVPSGRPGTAFPDTPKHKLTVSANYDFHLSQSVGDVSIGATWTWTSKVVTNFAEPPFVDGIPIGITPAFSLVNVNLDWKGIGGSPIDASFFVYNLANKAVKLPNLTSYAASGGAAQIGLMPPRMYGLRLRYRFGS